MGTVGWCVVMAEANSSGTPVNGTCFATRFLVGSVFLSAGRPAVESVRGRETRAQRFRPLTTIRCFKIEKPADASFLDVAGFS